LIVILNGAKRSEESIQENNGFFTPLLRVLQKSFKLLQNILNDGTMNGEAEHLQLHIILAVKIVSGM
jgi:hypothetical protein